jgi:hypothetical protein
MKRVVLALLLSAVFGGSVALAQAGGSLTGTIEGIVKIGENPVPGVLVTIESKALQGKRSAATGTSGDYIFRQLPPGSARSGSAYTVTFTLSGMKTVQKTIDVSLGGSTRQDATLEVSTASAAVTVSGTNIAAEEEKTAVHGATFTDETIQSLPVARTLDAIASLTPGLTTNTPNAGQLSISGAFAYDNKFLLNGVDINDNLFGTATNALVIEEAVQETQVMTSNISAEYGGFSGGIINAVTRSGGNTFSGSVRVDFGNPDWQAYNPNEAQNQVSRASDLSKTYSATLGGKIITDRLWFFLAGRYSDLATSATLPTTSESVSGTDKEPRLEGKLTANINESHTLQLDYTYSNEKQTNLPPFSFTAESSGDVNPSFPANIFVASYNGVFTPALIGSLRFSEKKFQFKDYGGTVTDVVTGSPFFSGASGTQPFLHYNAPYFDATDPEDRNNRDIAGSLSYYVSAGKLGSHELKAGFDIYTSIHTGGNSQSPSNYVFYTDYKTDAGGNPVFDANHRLIPTFVPGVSQRFTYLANRGAEADLRTDAFYVNDSMRFDRFSFNLGLRYEAVKGTGPGGSTITDTHAFVPRLGAVWDVKGDGRYQVSGSYAQYAGKYNDAQFNQGTVVGNPNGLYAVYTGPAGEGYGFAPGFNNANYNPYAVNFPLANVFFGDNVSAPITTEFTLSVGGKFTPTFNAAVTYVWRDTKNFVEDFIDNPTDSGKTEIISDGVSYGFFDNKYIRNTDVPKRRYQALQLQTSWTGVPNLQLFANYTYMLKFEGTFVGENTNQPGISSPYGNYPEISALDRTDPYGNLPGFQRHKLRLLGAYNLKTPVGVFTPGVIYNFDSGTPYNITSIVGYTDIQKARDPGYASLPNSQTIFFGGRGAGTYPSQQRWDASFEWAAPLHKTIVPYVRFAILNVFNTAYLVNYDISVIPNDGKNGHPVGPLDANGLPTTYTPGPNFGTATSSTNYQTSRTLTVAAGVRF